MPMLELVCATRVSRARFLDDTALGASLKRTAWDKRIRNHVFFENTRGLSSIYNDVINGCPADSMLLFVHDDVWLDDFNIFERIADGLTQFDVIGVAGNTRIPAQHCGWPFVDDQLTWDAPNFLSGRVAHGKAPFGPVSHFGAVPQRCELLDGLFLAANAAILKSSNVRFDEQFTFHFYDLDFCRSASLARLKLGTWPISLTHQSGGNFGSDAWLDALARYRAKWAAQA